MKKTTSTRKKILAIKGEKSGQKPLHKESAVEECCNNEVDKINQNLVDRITELPDDILVSIISLLTFKEATATSILSTRWRHLYTHIISLDFRFPFEPEKFDFDVYNQETQEEEFSDYISRINHTLNSYKGGLVSKDFRLHMPCLVGADIEKWLEFALSREVQIIDIHMVYCIKAKDDPESYTFPLSTLIIKNGSQILPGLKCLKELSLTAVHVDDHDIKQFLSFFCVLERLSVESPGEWSWKKLKNVNLVGHCKLKHFNISDTLSVKTIVVRDMISLVSLRCYGLRPTYVLVLVNVPNLAEFETSDETYTRLPDLLPRISCIHDQLLRLKLCTASYYRMNPEPTYMVPRLINLKHMELEFVMAEDYVIYDAFPLIEACPSLEKLEVEFWWGRYEKRIHRRRLRKDSVARKNPHHNIKNVRLSGFFGSISEVEFALYVMNNAVALEEFIVKASDVSRFIRQRAIARASKHLQSVAPNSVNFVIM